MWCAVYARGRGKIHSDLDMSAVHLLGGVFSTFIMLQRLVSSWIYSKCAFVLHESYSLIMCWVVASRAVPILESSPVRRTSAYSAQIGSPKLSLTGYESAASEPQQMELYATTRTKPAIQQMHFDRNVAKLQSLTRKDRTRQSERSAGISVESAIGHNRHRY